MNEEEFKSLKVGDLVLANYPGKFLYEVEVMSYEWFNSPHSYLWCLTPGFGICINNGENIAACVRQQHCKFPFTKEELIRKL